MKFLEILKLKIKALFTVHPLIRLILSLTLFSYIRNYLLTVLPYFIAISISIIITYVIQSLFEVILNWFKSKINKVNSVELNKIGLNKKEELLYIIFSVEDLELWAKKKGLYNKVPSKLWVDLKEAKDSCTIKNYNLDFSKNNLKLRYDNYDKYVQIALKIIKYL